MNHLHNAIRKCSYQGYDRRWGGYLLPKEVLALRDFGVADLDNVDWAIDCKRSGIIYGRWTYFNLLKGENESKFKILKEGLHHGS
ncbi:MAG: hypothetical protein AMJ56_07590 [Anaerolineae bacterium SG8_19]|nr:MAG: hypothetical protein AMJ56_07590 [Anaerolineae bacterium SG8_19]